MMARSPHLMTSAPSPPSIEVDFLDDHMVLSFDDDDQRLDDHMMRFVEIWPLVAQLVAYQMISSILIFCTPGTQNTLPSALTNVGLNHCFSE